jgi:hypothetical protein
MGKKLATWLSLQQKVSGSRSRPVPAKRETKTPRVCDRRDFVVECMRALLGHGFLVESILPQKRAVFLSDC